jgi:ubiquinone biosynthesis accessory factor UbiJ
MTPLNHLSAKFANRVLGDYPIAQQRLQAFATSRIFVNVASFNIALPNLTIALRVTSQGVLEPCGNENEPTVTPADLIVSIPLAALPAGITSGRDALKLATFSGNTELAALLHELANHLSWDAEHDLSKIVGEIAAHRIANTARSVHEGTRESFKRLTENGAEYLVHEAQLLVSRPEVRNFQAQLETLRDDIARLEKRASKLAGSLS